LKIFSMIALLTMAAAPASALAYLDPGTGSMMLQVILGGIAAVGVAIKLFWYKIIAFLGFKKKEPGEEKAG
jgi:hypothetical protein